MLKVTYGYSGLHMVIVHYIYIYIYIYIYLLCVTYDYCEFHIVTVDNIWLLWVT